MKDSFNRARSRRNSRQAPDGRDLSVGVAGIGGAKAHRPEGNRELAASTIVMRRGRAVMAETLRWRERRAKF
jgi:hypothetical protein